MGRFKDAWSARGCQSAMQVLLNEISVAQLWPLQLGYLRVHTIILTAATKKLKWKIIGKNPIKERKWNTKKYLINNF